MNAFDLAIVASSCAAAFSVLRRPVRVKRSMLPTGVLFWAAACILQTSSVYNSIDPALGGRNVTNLIYRSLAVVALGCLSVMVLRATRGLQPDVVSESLVAGLTAAVLGTQAAVFLANSWPDSDTYLARYGGQLGREVFWNVMTLGVAAFAVLVLVTAGKEWRAHSVRSTRWGLALIGFSAVLDLAWVIENLIASTVRMTGPTSLLLANGRDPIAGALLIAMISCTGAGVAIAPAEAVVERTWMRMLLIRITPLWRRAIRLAPDLSLNRETFGALACLQPDVEDLLYRRWVEILDCERAGALTPSSADRRLLDLVAAAFTGEPPASRSASRPGISSLLGVGSGANQ